MQVLSLPPLNGHDAVVVVLAAVLLDQRVERLLALRPVDAAVLELVLAADVADAGRIERDRLVRLRQARTEHSVS